MVGATILLVTSDSDLQSSLTEAISALAIEVEPVLSVAKLLASPQRNWQAGGCCIVVDAASLGSDAALTIAEVAARTSPVPVIALVQAGDLRLAVDLMRAGCYYVTERQGELALLASCVESSLAPDGLAQRRRQAAMTQVGSQLSASEHDLLRLTLAGASNKQIAHRLDVSLRTVVIRRAKLMGKLGASSRTELVRLAAEAGLGNQDADFAAL